MVSQRKGRRLKKLLTEIIKIMNTNIIVTSAGKRVTLVRMFQKELKRSFPNSKVYTADMNPKMAPAGYVSDGCFKVPRCTDENYMDRLRDICVENDISIIVPTIDTELLPLTNNKDFFKEKGISVIVPDVNFVKICRDKRNTSALLEKLNIRVPKTIDKNNPVYPMFAKPYDGSLSTNLHVIRNKEDLTEEILNDPKLLFMEFVDKNEYKEFTVDMYYGKDNRVKGIVPRERIFIRAGEINQGITRKNYLVDFLKQRMGYMPGVIGCICIQLFYREKDNDVIGIEINPRFGGGYPLSYYAKANYQEYIINEYIKNETVSYSDQWLDNTIMLRYDNDVIVYEDGSCNI